MQIDCKQAEELARIINQTSQLEDLLYTEGMEKEVRDISLPVPAQIPLLAEKIDAFNRNIASFPSKPTNQEVRDLVETSESLRKEVSPFLLASFTNCVISMKGGD